MVGDSRPRPLVCRSSTYPGLGNHIWVYTKWFWTQWRSKFAERTFQWGLVLGRKVIWWFSCAFDTDLCIDGAVLMLKVASAWSLDTSPLRQVLLWETTKWGVFCSRNKGFRGRIFWFCHRNVLSPLLKLPGRFLMKCKFSGLVGVKSLPAQHICKRSFFLPHLRFFQAISSSENIPLDSYRI